MIKIDIDFRSATEAEIKALYEVPGFQAAISHVQTHNRNLNTILTVIEPRNQIVEVKVLIMEFMRSQKLEVGNVLISKPFAFMFVPSLNPKQAGLVDTALELMVGEGVLTEGEGGNYRLTQLGFDAIY